MSCACEIRDVFECPVCGRQTVNLVGEPYAERPFVCDMGHRLVEMEQRLPDAFRSEFQHIDWDRDLSAEAEPGEGKR